MLFRLWIAPIALFLNYGNINRAVRPNDFAEFPTGIFEDSAEFVLRYKEVIEPGRPAFAKANAEADLTAHPSSSPIKPVIPQVFGPGGIVGIAGLGEDEGVGAGDGIETPEEPSGALEAAEQAEVDTEHHHGIEDPDAGADPKLSDGHPACIADSAQAANLKRQRRVVNRKDIVTLRLKIERDAPGAAAYVQNSASG